MRSFFRIIFLGITLFLPFTLLGTIRADEGATGGTVYRSLPVKVYRDKMKAAWIGQIAGVCWGAPTEFRFGDQIMPEDAVPEWKPEMINDGFGQDDLYVEMTFLRSLEEYGLDVPIRQAGIDFANSEYSLWCANNAGRKNLRRGIAPPDSSHPEFSTRGNDIDYQIESDFSGIIAPGLPSEPIRLGQIFGRLMNYGDGVYAGQFMGGMYSEAYFEDDVEKIVEAGLRCIPAESQYAEMVRDMLAWHRENPDDWEWAWGECQKKYREDPEYQQASNGGIDVKINGAYVVMGLLYGNRDLDRTILISMRGGFDSDCNPSSAGGVIFTTYGFSRLPARFTEKLDHGKKFNYTSYSFDELLDVCEKLTRQIVIQNGGSIGPNEDGEETFFIPVQTPVPSPLERTYAPGPIAGSRFTDEERARIKFREYSLEEAVAEFFPGWTLSDCGSECDPGYRKEYGGKENVILTHPKDQKTPCSLTKKIEVPATGKTTLRVVNGYFTSGDQIGDWELRIRVDGKLAMARLIGKEFAPADGWVLTEFDLTPWAGKSVEISLENFPNDWSWEAGYWASIDVVNE